METFAGPRDLVDNPDYLSQRQASLASLDLETIDRPIVDIVADLNGLPYCFTLQSCYGHFVHAHQQDRMNAARLEPADSTASVTYRLAYVALCIGNNALGKALLEDLRDMATADPEFVQLGSAEWFWDRQVNSYAVQVEPVRFKDRDEVILDYPEALRVQDARDALFADLRACLTGTRCTRRRTGSDISGDGGPLAITMSERPRRRLLSTPRPGSADRLRSSVRHRVRVACNGQQRRGPLRARVGSGLRVRALRAGL